ncbi:hypothetical protein OAP05_07445 [Schleiferiaceae bacterium]|nr:hypothetical protein [Schleiferiaceae bacterium]
MNVKLFVAFYAVIMAVSCTPTKVVVPLNDGQWQIGVTQGRPQINEGYLPVIGAYAAKGVSSTKTNYGGIQFSSLLLGAVQLEAGQVATLVPQQGFKPGISYSYGAQSFLSTRDYTIRFYPEAGLNAYLQNGPHILNASANTWVDPTWFLADFGRGQILAPSFSAGYRLRYKWFEAQLEYKILNPTREIHIPQNYIPSTAGLGGRGTFWGIAINF